MNIGLNDLSPNQTEALKLVAKGGNIDDERLWEQLWDLGLVDAINTDPKDDCILQDVLTNDGLVVIALINRQVQA